MSALAWPARLTFRAGAQELFAQFDDGKSGTVGYKRLREESPSAEVQGHGRGPKPPQAPVPEDIRVLKAEPVGRYAVRLFFLGDPRRLVPDCPRADSRGLTGEGRPKRAA